MDWSAKIEMTSLICTLIQLVEWSAVWSAALLTPKNNIGLECGLALNLCADWSAGLHSKKPECSNALHESTLQQRATAELINFRARYSVNVTRTLCVFRDELYFEGLRILPLNNCFSLVIFFCLDSEKV